MYLNYPNNPTGALAPEGSSSGSWCSPRARASSWCMTSRTRRSPTTAPPGARSSRPPREGGWDRGVLALEGYSMTGWAARPWSETARRSRPRRPKKNIDSGLFEAVQLAGVAALRRRPTPRSTDQRALPHPLRPSATRCEGRARVHRRRARCTWGRRPRASRAWSPTASTCRAHRAW